MKIAVLFSDQPWDEGREFVGLFITPEKAVEHIRAMYNQAYVNATIDYQCEFFWTIRDGRSRWEIKLEDVQE